MKAIDYDSFLKTRVFCEIDGKKYYYLIDNQFIVFDESSEEFHTMTKADVIENMLNEGYDPYDLHVFMRDFS